jgi:carboxyl-terminal processing protease
MNIKLAIALLAPALVSPAFGDVDEAGPASESGSQQSQQPLDPTTEHRFTTRLASRFLTSYHYKSEELDDALSERIFAQYLELLDPNRMYFQAGDIEQLERHRTRLDEALRAAEIEPAFEIFAIYRDRVDERITHALALLDS